MGDRLVGTLVGVLVGVLPGFGLVFITEAVTNGFEDQAGMPFGLLGMLLIVVGAGVGGIQGSRRMPPTRGQAIAGVVLGALPGALPCRGCSTRSTSSRWSCSSLDRCGLEWSGGARTINTTPDP